MHDKAVMTFLAIFIAALFAGCRGPEPRATAPRVDPEPPPQQELQPLKYDRQPYSTGDYIVYPLNWRKARDVAPRLYALLYPKYGPHISIVPDENSNSLLIYVPPRRMRMQEMDWHYYMPQPYYPNYPIRPGPPIQPYY